MANYSLNPNNNNNTWYGNDYLNDIHSLQQEQEQDLRLAEAGYGELNAQANLLEKLAQDVQGKDSVAYKNYMDYVNNLRQHTDVLATQGLNPNVTRNLIQAKNDYSRIISPIEEAMKKREELAKNQAEYLKQHPNAVFEKDAHDIGIDQMIKNPNYVPRQLDLEVVASRAKERFEALKNQATQFVTQAGGLSALTKDPQKLRQFIKVHAPYLYDSKYTTGVDPDEIRRLISGDKSLEKALTAKIAEETFNMYGMNSWNTDYDHWSNEQNAQRRYNMYNQLMDTITGGAGHAIGQTTFEKHFDNVSGELAYKWADLNWRKQQAARAAAQETINNWNLIRGNGEKSDNENGRRADDINEATNLLKAKGVSKVNKLLDYKTIIKALNEVDKEIQWVKGGDNTKYYEKVNKLLNAARIEESTKAEKMLSEQKKYTEQKVKEALKIAENKLNTPETKQEYQAFILNNPTDADKVEWLKQKYSDKNNTQPQPTDGYSQEFSDIINNATAALETVKKLEQAVKLKDLTDDNVGDFEWYSDSDYNHELSTYQDKVFKNAGYNKTKNTEGKDIYLNANGEEIREGAIDDVLDYNSDVHYTDIGGTKMDKDVSKDMATLLFNMQGISHILTNGGGYGVDEYGNPIDKSAWTETDQQDINKWLGKAMDGDEFMQIVPDYDYDKKRTQIKVAFWDANGDKKEPDKILYLNPAAFDQDSTFTDTDGNVHYTRDVMQEYINNMDQAMLVYNNPLASRQDRDNALKSYNVNNRLLHAAMNKARMQISTKARAGRSTGEGPIAENTEAAIMARANTSK